MAQIPLPQSCNLDPAHDLAQFDLDGRQEAEGTSPTQSSLSGATTAALSFECLSRQGCEGLNVDDGDFSFNFVGELRTSVESMLEQMNDVGKVPVSFWRPDRDFGPISEPVSRSPSTVNNLGQLLAFVPGRDAISQPVSRSVSHMNGFGSVGANARGKEAAQTTVPLVPKSNSALSSLGGIWGNVPRSATALGHMWTAASARESLAPRSVSAINNLGERWTGTSTSGLSNAEQGSAEEEEEGEEEEEEEQEALQEAVACEEEHVPSPPRPPPALGGIPRVAPMEFGARSPAAEAVPIGLPSVGIPQLMGQALLLPVVPSRPLPPYPGPMSAMDVAPSIMVAPASPAYHPPPVRIGAADSPPRNRRERRKYGKPSQTFQHIQVLSDKVDSRVAEQGYYLAPSTEFRVSKSKSRATAEAKGTNCLPTYTYDYGTEADPGVWDILRSTMLRGRSSGGAP